MTDCAFRTEEGRFYYCVRAIIIRNGKLLAMHDEVSPYYYLPGGKVGMGETAEQAVLREVKEELGVNAQIVRELWFAQNFFTEKVKNECYHELGIYFLLQINDYDLIEEKFVTRDGKHTLRFEWLPFERLQNEHFYPTFVKNEIFDLPKSLKMIIERE